MSHAPSAAIIRTAVVGYGLAGSAFHAPLIAANDGFALRAIVTANPERAAAARLRYPGASVRARFDDLWSDADALDLIVIASPNSSHLPLALAAIDAGVAVLIDKPVAATVADAERLREAAAAAGVLVSVFQNRRWDGDLLTLRRLLRAGELGSVHRFESRFERWRPQVVEGAWREQPQPAEAGGLLYDLGSHLIDQAVLLFGAVTRVYAEVRGVRARAHVDDDVFVALQHAGGTTSHLFASAVAADAGPRFRVLGDKAAYVKHGLDVQEDALRAGRTPREDGWGTEPESSWGYVGTPGDIRAVPTEAGAYQDYYAGIRTSLLDGTAPPVTVDEAIGVLAIIEAAQRSVRDHQIVSL